MKINEKKSQNKLLHFENYENKNSFLKTNKKNCISSYI